MDTKEGQLVNAAEYPATVDSTRQELIDLGVKSGMTLLVHTSLSKIGWVCGGAVSVILALLDVLEPKGTLVMPTHSGELSDPANWQNPPVPQSWWPVIYENMPAYRPDLTPTRAMGAIPEAFRGMKGVLRSNHPQLSFAAFGSHAELITNSHNLEHGMAEKSPLARVYDLDGWVLLLGVGYGNNTSLHLAENRARFPGKKCVKSGAPILLDGVRQWVEFEQLDYNEKDFSRIGEDFSRESGLEISGMVGQAKSRLMPQRGLVDFAVNWMEKNRN